MFKKDTVILFQGDSVTAAERKYGTDDLGEGYAAKINAYLQTFYPDKNIKVINKGVDGHKAEDLLVRWQEECIDLKPDIISVMVGMNDCWKAIETGYENDPAITENFENCYREMLTRVRNELPDCRIILLEPFFIPTKRFKVEWRVPLYSKIEVVRRLAREFRTAYIPLDGLFAELCVQNDPEEYSADSVHPIDGGHNFIAKQWLKRVE